MYHRPSNTPVTIKYEVPRIVYVWVIVLLAALVVLSLVGDWVLISLVSFLVNKSM